MNVIALGKFEFSSVIPSCWGEQLEGPAGIVFPLRHFSPTFVNFTAIRFKAYDSIWAPSSRVSLFTSGGVGRGWGAG